MRLELQSQTMDHSARLRHHRGWFRVFRFRSSSGPRVEILEVWFGDTWISLERDLRCR